MAIFNSYFDITRGYPRHLLRVHALHHSGAVATGDLQRRHRTARVAAGCVL